MFQEIEPAESSTFATLGSYQPSTTSLRATIIEVLGISFETNRHLHVKCIYITFTYKTFCQDLSF